MFKSLFFSLHQDDGWFRSFCHQISGMLYGVAMEVLEEREEPEQWIYNVLMVHCILGMLNGFQESYTHSIRKFKQLMTFIISVKMYIVTFYTSKTQEHCIYNV